MARNVKESNFFRIRANSRTLFNTNVKRTIMSQIVNRRQITKRVRLHSRPHRSTQTRRQGIGIHQTPNIIIITPQVHTKLSNLRLVPTVNINRNTPNTTRIQIRQHIIRITNIIMTANNINLPSLRGGPQRQRAIFVRRATISGSTLTRQFTTILHNRIIIILISTFNTSNQTNSFQR